MAQFRGIESLRAIDWSNPILWEVKFQTVAGDKIDPFSDWVPAVDIEVDEASVESHTWQGTYRPYKIPIGFGQRFLKMTVVDNSEHIMKNFFRKWIDTTIGNNEKYISALETSVKQCVVKKFSKTMSVIEQCTYYLYPEGTLLWRGDNEGKNPHTYLVPFVIAGESENQIIQTSIADQTNNRIAQNRLQQAVGWVQKQIGI